MLSKPTIDGSWGKARGWDAGAASVPTLAGDIRLDYKPEAGLIGSIVGIRATDDTPWVAPGRITHGFYCYTNDGSWATPIERNVMHGTPFTYVAGDTLSIIRNGGNVTYLHNGTQIYASSTASVGRVHAAACLYAAGDSVT